MNKRFFIRTKKTKNKKSSTIQAHEWFYTQTVRIIVADMNRRWLVIFNHELIKQPVLQITYSCESNIQFCCVFFIILCFALVVLVIFLYFYPCFFEGKHSFIIIFQISNLNDWNSIPSLRGTKRLTEDII